MQDTSSKKTSGGFTIFELMIATSIFAIALTGMVALFMQIGRMYYKGVSVNTTYESAWRALGNIENDVRFSANVLCATKGSQNCTPDATQGIHYFCIGNHRYTYFLSNSSPYKIQSSDITNANSTNNPRGIIEDVINGCPDPSIPGASPTQLMAVNTQLNDFGFYCVNSGCHVHLHIVYYGADDSVFGSSENPNTPSAALLDKDNYCSGGLLSSEYCAVADISSSVDVGI